MFRRSWMGLVAVLVAVGLLAGTGSAGVVYWKGSTSTDWNVSTNWNSTPTYDNTMVATFDDKFGDLGNQPSIGSSDATISWLNVKSTATRDITISGSGTLVMYGDGDGDGIALDSLSTKSLTINPNIRVWYDSANSHDATQWSNNGSGTLTVAGNVLLDNANPSGSKVLTIGGSGTTVINGAISAEAGTWGLTKSGTGTLTLSGANTYTGATTIKDGALQADDNAGLPGTSSTNGGSYLQLDGGVLQSNSAISFTRANSTTPGGGNFTWTTNGGGFSANTGKLTVTIGGSAATEQVWAGSAGDNRIVGTLKFGSATANKEVEFQNNIDLANAIRTIDVATGAGGDFATLSGVIRSVGGGGGITKTGTGTLKLSGANTFDGALTAGNGTGTVILANNQAMGVPSATRAWTFGTTDTLALVGGITLSNPSNYITWQINGTGDSRLGTTPGAIVNISGNNTAPVAIILAAASKIGSQTAGDKLTISGGISGNTFGLTVDGVGDTELSGAITTTTGTLTKTGTGTLTLGRSKVGIDPELGGGENMEGVFHCKRFSGTEVQHGGGDG